MFVAIILAGVENLKKPKNRKQTNVSSEYTALRTESEKQGPEGPSPLCGYRLGKYSHVKVSNTTPGEAKVEAMYVLSMCVLFNDYPG